MPHATRPLRLLVVDDQDQLREVVAELLSHDDRFDDTVLRARDGADAIRDATREHPEAVLLDNSMPVLDGLSALPELRRVLPDSCIVLFTADTSVADRARSLGADGVVAKGTTVADLADALDAAC